jgi:hypothetical protein
VKGLIYRWRLWRICRKLKIKPMKWQKDYVMGKLDGFYGPLDGRRTGKTTAVILWGLVRKVKTKRIIEKLSMKDPDVRREPDYSQRYIMSVFVREYAKMARKAGMEVEQ